MDVMFDKFLDRLRGLSSINRWNFHPTITKENVAEHSAWVAIYAMLLALIDGVDEKTLASTVVHGLCHDFEESVTGDLPMLVKRQVGDTWEGVELNGMIQLIKFLPTIQQFTVNHYKFMSGDDGQYARKAVKAADILDCVIYARNERHMGNTKFGIIELECVTKLRRMHMDSVDQILNAYGYPKHEHSAVELPADMTHL